MQYIVLTDIPEIQYEIAESYNSGPPIVVSSDFDKKIFRQYLRFTVNVSSAKDVDLIHTLFKRSPKYFHREYANDMSSYQDYDRSEYCILGDIIYHPDNTVTVFMKKKTDNEVLVEELQKTNNEYIDALSYMIVTSLLNE